MSSNLLGDIGGIGSVADLAKDVVDKLMPDKQQAERDAAVLALTQFQGAVANSVAQLGVNTAEASNKSLFVSGWRPFIGWVCGAALVYQFIARPLVVAFVVMCHQPAPDLPGLDDNLYQVLTGMLGLGIFRTIEKIKGVAAS